MNFTFLFEKQTNKINDGFECIFRVVVKNTFNIQAIFFSQRPAEWGGVRSGAFLAFFRTGDLSADKDKLSDCKSPFPQWGSKANC